VHTTTSIDLTPFGFTTTETLVYGRLLRGGPSTGYAVARDLTIARANAYQALRGLVSKGAAAVTAGDPPQYRAVRAADLYAAIVERQTLRLDTLEKQLFTLDQPGAPSFVQIEGDRAFVEVAARTAAREGGPVTFVAPARLLIQMMPVLRKRIADSAETRIWAVGDNPGVPLPLAGSISPEQADSLFGFSVAVLLTRDSALVARLTDRDLAGFWTSDPVVAATARAAVVALTRNA
jgi:hypothetical protein